MTSELLNNHPMLAVYPKKIIDNFFEFILIKFAQLLEVRMAERSKALRSGRSLVLQAWVRIPLLTVSLL